MSASTGHGSDFAGAALWVFAAGLAISSHVGVGWWLLGVKPSVPPPSPPAGAIAFELAPVPSGPDQGFAEPQPVLEPETEQVRRLDERSAPEPVAEPRSQQVDEPTEATQDDRSAPIQVEDAPEPENELASVPVPTPRPAHTPPVRPAPQREPTEPPRPFAPAAVPAPAASGQANAPRVAAPREGRAESRPAVSPARWQAALLAHLERHKRYPPGARARREQGTAQLSFAIDRSGSVISSRVTRSSGSAELDQAVLDMVRRASPVPAPPDTVQQLSFSVPVRFSLR